MADKKKGGGDKQPAGTQQSIALEGMEFYAYHGFYDEERIIGGNYIVDVYAQTMITKAAVSDDLKDAINYEIIYHICQREMRQAANLIENVAARISLGIKTQYSNIKDLKVRVRKLNPPLPGKVASSVTEMNGNFQKKCGKCYRPMLCYGDRSCWCMDTTIAYEKTLDHLKLQYGSDCFCKDCLRFLVGTDD